MVNQDDAAAPGGPPRPTLTTIRRSGDAPAEGHDIPSFFTVAQEGPEEEEESSPFSAPEPGDIDEAEPEAGLFPRAPRSFGEVGLSKAFLSDLTLKILYYAGTPTVQQLTRRLGLNTEIVNELITGLGEDRLVEVISQSDLYTGNYRYRLSERGNARVSEALERTRYAGMAPVTADQYSHVMNKLHAHKQEVPRARIKEILNELVLDGDVGDHVSRALFSGKSAILYGPSGNGKTVILERFAKDLGGFWLVPAAIYAFGQVIRVFDPSIHQVLTAEEEVAAIGAQARLDRRWLVVKRPAMVLGAEMDRDALDMAYDPQSRFYQAPPHIKVQGGALIVDDFGRQAIDAKELFTRWLIPLERGWDTLGLQSGEKLTLPFKTQILFATNLRVKQLADSSLLRRVLYKVHISGPTVQGFQEILRQSCRQRNIVVEDGILDYIADCVYNEPRLKPRAAYTRDVLDMLVESAAFDGKKPVLDRESFDRVFRLFLAQETEEEDDDWG